MNMVGDKRPGKTIRMRFRKQFRQPVQKILPVIIGSKYLTSFDSSDDHMMQRTRRIYSCFSWHNPSNTRRDAKSKS